MLDNNPWDLYNNYENLTDATREINEAVDKAYQAVFSDGPHSPMKAWEVFVRPVLLKHNKGGALDTEPRTLTRSYLQWWVDTGKRPTFGMFI